MRPKPDQSNTVTVTAQRRLDALARIGLDEESRTSTSLHAARTRAVESLVLDLKNPEERDFGEHVLLEPVG